MKARNIVIKTSLEYIALRGQFKHFKKKTEKYSERHDVENKDKYRYL